jgi:heptosyltransferase-2
MNSQRLLIWLPSPLGDAIMATPALNAFRSNLPDVSITFLTSRFTREILSPSPFCDNWLDLKDSFLGNYKQIKSGTYDSLILLKNSFSSALTAWLVKIPRRIGYASDMRAFLLTDPIDPFRNEQRKLMPVPMIDYYLRIARILAMTSDSKKTCLCVTAEQRESMLDKLPQLRSLDNPLVILVPGGAFGPSKLWPLDRYAELADRLHENYQATVLLSVAPARKEMDIAEAICEQTKSNPINLGKTPLDGGQFKALFNVANLVITNDTGPRHIAIGLDKPVVSLFGPNNPKWTQSWHEKEIQIFGWAPCVPCDKPVCRQKQHLCMESITVNEVFDAAAKFLSG